MYTYRTNNERRRPACTNDRRRLVHALVALPLLDSSFTRPLGIIQRRRPRLSAAACRFLDLLLEDNAAAARRNGEAGSLAAGTPHFSAASSGHRARNGLGATR